MEKEIRCPTCGSKLSSQGQECPYCAEARKLVLQLAAEEPIRLCTRCGVLLDEQDRGPLCKACELAAKRPPPIWRREDRVAGWIQRVLDKPAGDQETYLCPHCTHLVDRSAIFCPHCGKRLPEATEQAPEGDPSPAPAVEPTLEKDPLEVERPAEDDLPLDRVGPAPAARGTDDAVGYSIWRELQGLGRGLWEALRHPSRPKRQQAVSAQWIWVLLVILLAFLAMAFFWMQLLNTGDITFR